MKAAGTIRTFFLIFMFLAFFIDNPFSGVFGGYEAFTGLFSNLFFANFSSVFKIPLPFSFYEWSIFLFAFLIYRRSKGLGSFPSAALHVTLLYWGYVLFWIFVSIFFLGADRQAIFWDFKGLITLPFLMFIFARLFPTPTDWIAPFKVFSAAILFKCLQALFLNAFIWKPGRRLEVGYLIDHAASYQISCVLLVILGVMIFRYWRPKDFFAIAGILAVIMVLLAAFVMNQRRTEMFGFALSLFLMGGIFATRRIVATIILFPFVAAFVAAYIAIFSNSNSLLGKPIQLLSSLNESKNLSNLYRNIENYNLVTTIAENPFFGHGFGVPMRDFAGLSAFLDSNFFLLHPHNSILGLWMQAGIIGLALFMLLFAVFAFHALRLIISQRDPLRLIIGVVAFSNLFRYLLFSLGDQLFLHSSGNFVLGASMGAIVMLADPNNWRENRRVSFTP